jgi:hypothetical protein
MYRRPATHPEGIMQRYYYGLPAAPSVAEAILQAQLLILKAASGRPGTPESALYVQNRRVILSEAKEP